jgi:O-antigen/teichoic acid export membrane protein
VLGKVLLFLYNLFLARALGAHDFGLYIISYSLVLVGVDVISVLNPDTIARFAGVYFDRNDRGKLKGLITLSVASATVLGIVAAALTAGSSRFIAEVVFHKSGLLRTLPFFLMALPLLGALRLIAAYFVATRRPHARVMLLDLLPPIVTMAALGAARWFDGLDLLRYVSISYAAAVGLCAAAGMVSLWRSGYLAGDRNLDDLGEILAYSKTVYLISNMNNLIRRGNMLIVAYFLTEIDAGVFGVVEQLGLLITLVIMSFNAVFGPRFAALHSRQDVDGLYDVYALFTRLSTVGTLPLFVIAVVAGDGVLGLLYGTEYAVGHVAFAIMAAGQVVHAMTAGAGMVMKMTGFERHELRVVSIAGVASVIVNAVLTPLLGINGAALGKTLSLAGIQSLRLSVLRHLFHKPLLPWRARGALVAAGLGIAIASALRLLLGSTSTSAALVAGLCITALAAYLGFLCLFGAEEEDRALVRDLWERIRSHVRGC